MAEPKQKSTRSSRKHRLYKNRYIGFSLTKCQKCGNLIKPHFACSSCGYYRSKKIIETTSSANKVKTKVTKK